MFTGSAEYYDAIYAYKDYESEAAAVHGLIRRHGRSPGARLLDVACGTGAHLGHLARHYAVEGLDADPAMLALARQRLPGVVFHEAGMTDFDTGRRYDAVICLFSSIGYARSVQRLEQAVDCMARHLVEGGVLIVEPWLTPDRLKPGTLHAVFVDRPDLKISRMNVTRVEGELTVLDFHYLVGTPDGIESFRERHEMGNFTHEQYLHAFEASGLCVIHDAEGLTGRGLYVGLQSDPTV